jgi:8-oxo-dGTP pyrophosphatase MutT (NUDIX family)
VGRKDAALGDVIRAAGGLVWRNSSRGREVALIHRPKYDDWTLPKGKLTDGESWQEAAVREVEEETGLDVRIGDFAGGCTYLTKRAPKIVLYWHMEVEGETKFAGANEEADALEWMSVEDARKRLTHRRERRVLADSIAHAAASKRKREQAP